jgi:hypothetical protein
LETTSRYGASNIEKGCLVGVLKEPVFEEPTVKPKQSRYERVLEPLRGTREWAKIGEYKSTSSAYQAALNLRHGNYRIPGKPENWEFVSDDNAVFARWTGKAK